MKQIDLEALISSKDYKQLEQALADNKTLALTMTSMGVSLVTFAAYYRNSEAVALIRRHLPSLTLHEACCVGELSTVRTALEKNPAAVNALSPDGFTPLGLACFFGHENVVDFLLVAGADVNTASNNQLRVAPLHSACAISSFSIARKLLEAGANVNARQQQNFVALHSACQAGNLELVQLLVEHGARTDSKSDDGKLPVDMAREKGFHAVVGFLGGIN